MTATKKAKGKGQRTKGKGQNNKNKATSHKPQASRAEIDKYIKFRYNNWLDYAKQMARVHRFTGFADDLLHDVILDLLKKDPRKLSAMYAAKTTKIVNQQPTTELDKFVLKMLAVNAYSPAAPFRKNTLGNKIIKRNGREIETAQHVELNGTDAPDEVYNKKLNKRLDAMHSRNMARLRKNGFPAHAVELYAQHFIYNRNKSEFNNQQQVSITSIEEFLTITKKTLIDD